MKGKSDSKCIPICCYCIMIVFAFFTPQLHLSVFSVHKLKSLPLFCNFHSFSAVLGQSQMNAKIDTKTKNYHRNFNSLLIISKQLRDDWSLLKWSVGECSREEDSELSWSPPHSTPTRGVEEGDNRAKWAKNDIDPNFFLKFWLILK